MAELDDKLNDADTILATARAELDRYGECRKLQDPQSNAELVWFRNHTTDSPLKKALASDNWQEADTTRFGAARKKAAGSEERVNNLKDLLKEGLGQTIQTLLTQAETAANAIESKRLGFEEYVASEEFQQQQEFEA